MANKFNVTALAATRDIVYVKVVPADNAYVAGGAALNLSPGSISDPQTLGVIGPTANFAVPPGIFSEALGGYYAQASQGTSLANGKLQFFTPGGAEIAAGAYPAAITGGTLILAIPYKL